MLSIIMQYIVCRGDVEEVNDDSLGSKTQNSEMANSNLNCKYLFSRSSCNSVGSTAHSILLKNAK